MEVGSWQGAKELRTLPLNARPPHNISSHSFFNPPFLRVFVLFFLFHGDGGAFAVFLVSSTVKPVLALFSNTKISTQ